MRRGSPGARRMWWAAACVLAIILGIAGYVDDWLFLSTHALFRFEGAPLLHATDGYFYLERARAVLQGAPALGEPLVSVLTAYGARVTGAPLALVASIVPPLCGVLTGAALVLWGRALTRNIFAALVAAVVGMSVPYWHVRAGVGYVDTDCLNVFFVLFGSWLLQRFVRSTGRRRVVWLAALGVVLALFGWWWRAGTAACVGLLAVTYAASLPWTPTRGERAVKLAIGGGVAVVALTLAVWGLEPFPQWLVRFLEDAVNHIRLVMRQEGGVYPAVSVSIGELKPPELGEFVTYAGGGWLTVAAGILGLGCAVWRRGGACLFLLPVVGLAAISAVSARFMLFVAPLVGLGCGALVAEAWQAARGAGRFQRAAQAASLALAVAVAAGPVSVAMRSASPPVFAGPEAVLASFIAKASPRSAVVWSWWDYGYMLRYFSQRPVYFDGGSQDPLRTFTAGWALMDRDPVRAARVMRFFTAHGPGALGTLEGRVGTPARAVALLREVFAQDADVGAVLAASGLPDDAAMRDYLFPAADVVVYLPMSILERTPWIGYFGTWDVAGGAGEKARFTQLSKDGHQVLAASGRVSGLDVSSELSAVVHAGRRGVGVRRYDAAGAPALVDLEALPHFVLVDGAMLESTLYRLLLAAPDRTRGFQPLAYDSRFGGVWRVKQEF
ncbi:STT3 domain-containing protein [Desulfobaculum sp.]